MAAKSPIASARNASQSSARNANILLRQKTQFVRPRSCRRHHCAVLLYGLLCFALVDSRTRAGRRQSLINQFAARINNYRAPFSLSQRTGSDIESFMVSFVNSSRFFFCTPSDFVSAAAAEKSPRTILISVHPLLFLFLSLSLCFSVPDSRSLRQTDFEEPPNEQLFGLNLVGPDAMSVYAALLCSSCCNASGSEEQQFRASPCKRCERIDERSGRRVD